MRNRILHALKRSLGILTFILIIFILQVGCRSSSPPLGGIAVRTFEAIGGIGNSEFPIAGAPNLGGVLAGPNGLQILGPGTGTELTLSGITDATGTSAYPNARTNAVWQVTAGPTTAPPCAAGTGVETVPPEGMTFRFVCVPFAF